VVCPALLKKLVESGNFPPQRLEIEITESCLHENIGLVRSIDHFSLRNQGVKISLDDFGTGYSSLEQLRIAAVRPAQDRPQLRVANCANRAASSRSVEAIISLGRGLDLPLTAEGVETRKSWALQIMGEAEGAGLFLRHARRCRGVRRGCCAGKLTRFRRRRLPEPDAKPRAQPESPGFALTRAKPPRKLTIGRAPCAACIDARRDARSTSSRCTASATTSSCSTRARPLPGR
jgi:hypothetical protein